MPATREKIDSGGRRMVAVEVPALVMNLLGDRHSGLAGLPGFEGDRSRVIERLLREGLALVGEVPA